MIRTLFVAALIAVAPMPATGQTSSCKPTDIHAQRMLSFLRQLVVTSQPDRVQLRNALVLKAMDSSKVMLVVDNAVCAKVAAGVNTLLGTPNLVRQLYVVKVGSDFATKDPGNPWGEWWPTITLDSRYKYKSSVLAP